MSEPAFIAVDWGTSSFRLWLIGASGEVLAERRSNEGMTTAAKLGFPEVLKSHLDAIDAPEGLPVIICGMAGARQGWIEAGYVDVPSPLDAILKGAVRIPGQLSDIRILPGLAQRAHATPDVIRGEETQLLGALASASKDKDQLVCMPGTHSKWVRVSNGAVSGFSTFMTGELFEAISKHTILAHAITDAENFTGESSAFTTAVIDTYKAPQMATNLLFTARSGQLLNGLSATDAKARLSGILIGLEIAGARSSSPEDAEVVLVASGGLGELYKAALRALSVSFETIDADDAVRRGLCAAAAAIWH